MGQDPGLLWRDKVQWNTPINPKRQDNMGETFQAMVHCPRCNGLPGHLWICLRLVRLQPPHRQCHLRLRSGNPWRCFCCSVSSTFIVRVRVFWRQSYSEWMLICKEQETEHTGFAMVVVQLGPHLASLIGYFAHPSSSFSSSLSTCNLLLLFLSLFVIVGQQLLLLLLLDPLHPHSSTQQQQNTYGCFFLGSLPFFSIAFGLWSLPLCLVTIVTFPPSLPSVLPLLFFSNRFSRFFLPLYPSPSLSFYRQQYTLTRIHLLEIFLSLVLPLPSSLPSYRLDTSLYTL